MWINCTTVFMRPSYRPHYASCPSVCPSVCLFFCVPYGLINSKTRKTRTIKIDVNVSQGTSAWSANFEFKRSKVKVTGRQKLMKLPHIWLTFTYGRRLKRWLLRPNWPNSLLDLVCCRRMRRSATRRTAAYHVGVMFSCLHCIIFMMLCIAILPYEISFLRTIWVLISGDFLPGVLVDSG